MKNDQQSRKQISAILILTPLMFLFFKLLLPSLPSSPMMRDAFWAHKVIAEPVYDAVLIGDSRVYRGLDPEQIEQQSGLKCFNYGFSSAGLTKEFIDSAVQKLNKNGRKYLVFGLSPNTFMHESLGNEHLHSVLKWSKSDLKIRAYWYPVLKCFDPVNLSDLYKAVKHEAYQEDYHIQNGFAASDKVPYDENSALQAYKHQFENDQLVKEKMHEFIQRIKDLKHEGYTVAVLRVPCSMAMIELEDRMTRHVMIDLIHEIKQQGISVFEPTNKNWRSYDGSHLSSESAKVLSVELGTYLKTIEQ